MAALSVTPPLLQGPTAKEKKYDRQLRLWAASGQEALEDAHVLLLNSGSGVVGTETLKNLVLPGVGSFTIVDQQTVKDEDLGVNFFLEEESMGKSRAQECCRFLKELNPEVNGFSVQKSAEEFISSTDLSQYTLILLVSPTRIDSVLRTVSDYAWDRSIPLIHIHSNGFYSQFVLQLPPLFPIVDTHPDPASAQDLRLLRPWPELLDLMHDKTTDLDSKSDHDHGHVPYLLLLLHYLERWKGSHDGKYPSDYREKSAFRDMVRSGARTNNAEGGEENFDEAIAAVLKTLSPPSVPSDLREIFDEAECKNPTVESANFWLIAHALSAFTANESVLPLPGSLPDMKAQSSDYIQLQSTYKSKARLDLSIVTTSVRELETRLDRKAPIESKEIEAFCKSAASVKLIRGRRIRGPNLAAKTSWDDRATYVMSQLNDEESLLPIFFALSALDYVVDEVIEHGPSDLDLFLSIDMSTSVKRMIDYVEELLDKFRLIDNEFETKDVKGRILRVLEEVSRTGPSELHNVASLTGGMVAQEAIKVITKQYVPVDNTCVFDGVGSRSAVFRL